MKIPRRGFLKGVIASVGAAGAAAMGLGSVAAVPAPVTEAPASPKKAFSKWLMRLKYEQDKQVRLPTSEQLRSELPKYQYFRDLPGVEYVEGVGGFFVPPDFDPSSVLGRIESPRRST